jgi:hypothetical protein
MQQSKRVRSVAVRTILVAALVQAAITGNGAEAVASQQQAAGGLVVSVAYAENIGNVPAVPKWFPTPWNGAPNTVFLGSPNPQTAECGSVPKALCYDTGAIRLDNPTGSPITVSNVLVDVRSGQSGGKLYNNLWGGFTVPAHQSVILAENPPPPARQSSFDNFDTSDTPHGSCRPATTPPTVALTIGGTTTTLTDTGHVLDTGWSVNGVFGGVDSGWCPTHQNESIQWQQIGAATRSQSACGGSAAPCGVAAGLNLSPASTTLTPGTTVTETATLAGGDGVGLPNAAISFSVTGGPNSGKSGSAITDITGKASWSYSDPGSTTGGDSVVASVQTDGTFSSNQSCVVWGAGSCASGGGGGCSSPWTCGNVGSPALAGSASLSSGTWTIQGAGNDIHSSADQFQFVSQPLAGDGSISARVTSQTNTSAWARAGVMLRTDSTAGSPNYALLVTPGNGIVVSYRSTQGGTTIVQHSIPTGTVPVYLKVARSATTFTAYTSPGNGTWTLVPGSTVTIGGMSGPLLEGLAVTSHNSTSLCTAVMDTVQAS